MHIYNCTHDLTCITSSSSIPLTGQLGRSVRACFPLHETNPPSVPCSSFHLSEHAKYKLDPHTLCLDCLVAFLMQCNVQQFSNVQPAAAGGGLVTTNCEAIITHCVQIFFLAGGVFLCHIPIDTIF